MAQYDAVIVFIIATIFVSFYIFIEARPHGSSFIADVKDTIKKGFLDLNKLLFKRKNLIFIFVFLAPSSWRSIF